MADSGSTGLRLGEPPGRLRVELQAASRRWYLLIVALELVACGLLLALWLSGRAAPAPGDNGLPRENSRQRDLALALEEKGLAAEAATAWLEYLRGEPAAEDAPQIWYRAGKLFVTAEDFSRAAAALVQAELWAGDDRELRQKTGPLLVTCLRRLGHHGDAARELTRRVQAGPAEPSRGRVLARIGDEEITDADLDRMVEQQVDQMLALQGGSPSESVRRQLLDQFHEPNMRQQLFQQLLQTELLVRRARELNLDRDPEFDRLRSAQEDRLLAARFQMQQLAQVQVTDVDIEAFYRGHQDRFQEPETLEVLLLPLADDGRSDQQPEQSTEDSPQRADGLKELLDRIRDRDTFRAAALAATPKGSDTAVAGAPAGEAGEDADAQRIAARILRGVPHPLLGDCDALFALQPGEWTRQPHEHQGKRFLVWVDKKEAARTRPLAEVRGQVEAEYQAIKREELAEKLTRDLMKRFDVQLVDSPVPAAGDPPQPRTQEPRP